MKIIEILKNYPKLISEGMSFKDKFIIFLHFLKIPIRVYYKIIGHEYKYSLRDSVTLKNKDGIFFCGSSSLLIWAGASFYENELKKYLSLEKGVFIDVGASIGKYTVILGKQLNGKGKVIAIEPEPNTFKILEKNVKLNKLKKITLLNLACSDSNDFVDFYLDAEGAGMGSSLIKKWGTKISVKTRTLDNLLKNLKIRKVDLIKIDVEEAEPEVLNGAIKMLKKDHPKIIFESLNSEHLKRVEKILSKFNYKIKKIDDVNYFAY